ncbi:MAG TPA: tyrosine-type recombinase/integrase [Acidothermaceae bacterium]
MTDLAPLLQGFFTDRLQRQRHASPHTITAYRDAFTLLLQFATSRVNRRPAQLSVADLDATLITAFLQHLHAERGNSAATRNARLAAIHSFFGYAAMHAPEHAAVIQRVLAIPPQRCDRAIVNYLTRDEAEALIAAPDRGTWLGRRDHALLLLAVHTGLRVSELTGLRIADVYLGAGPHVRCTGKGRKERCTPLTKPAIAVLRAWLTERAAQSPDPLFATRHGTALSRDAVAHLVTKHAATAAATCPSITEKTITPHTLRHTMALTLLHSGVDVTVIALWLGHESTDATQIYLHADMSIKERALARTTPSSAGTLHRYKPPDTLLAFLATL